MSFSIVLFFPYNIIQRKGFFLASRSTNNPLIEMEKMGEKEKGGREGETGASQIFSL